MKKLAKKNLNELALVMPIIDEITQCSFIGGGNGTLSDPYTEIEYVAYLASGIFPGGWVKFDRDSSATFVDSSRGISNAITTPYTCPDCVFAPNYHYLTQTHTTGELVEGVAGYVIDNQILTLLRSLSPNKLNIISSILDQSGFPYQSSFLVESCQDGNIILREPVGTEIGGYYNGTVVIKNHYDPLGNRLR